MLELLKRPSAWGPIVISVFMLGVMAYYALFVGLASQEDEGVGAHLFQLLMPIAGVTTLYFAVRYVPQAPRAALAVLALQLLLFAAVVAPVFYLGL